MNSPEPDFEQMLRVLAEHQVDFIVIGGMCAVLHGAPIGTLDLDVVHARTPANLDRLVVALRKLGAYYREQPQRRIQPDPSHLVTPGHHLLTTPLGSIDLLGTLSSGEGYEELLSHTLVVQAGEGLAIRMLDLPTLIHTKERAGREKDKLVLPILRHTLEEKQRKPDPEPGSSGD